jgi:transposase InsO family protein
MYQSTVERVISDNGACFRSRTWRQVCAELHIQPKRTQPYRPQTNGKICEDLNPTLYRLGLTPAKV